MAPRVVVVVMATAMAMAIIITASPTANIGNSVFDFAEGGAVGGSPAAAAEVVVREDHGQVAHGEAAVHHTKLESESERRCVEVTFAQCAFFICDCYLLTTTAAPPPSPTTHHLSPTT